MTLKVLQTRSPPLDIYSRNFTAMKKNHKLIKKKNQRKILRLFSMQLPTPRRWQPTPHRKVLQTSCFYLTRPPLVSTLTLIS